MTQMIAKVGAVIQNDQLQLLVVKKNVPGRDTYIIPGGRPEGDETEEETLRRELSEELGVTVEKFTSFGTYEEPAEFEDAVLIMTVFDVEVKGDPKPQAEIVDSLWIDAEYQSKGVSIGSILANHVVPGLVALGRM